MDTICCGNHPNVGAELIHKCRVLHQIRALNEIQINIDTQAGGKETNVALRGTQPECLSVDMNVSKTGVYITLTTIRLNSANAALCKRKARNEKYIIATIHYIRCVSSNNSCTSYNSI